MKKITTVILILSLCLLSFPFSSVLANDTDDATAITVVTTLFPQYDFVRQIGKDKVNVVMLLPPGVESHNFEPKPMDIITIANANAFIYTGEFMEPWAARVLSSINSKTLKVLDLSEGKKLIENEHEDLALHPLRGEHDHGMDPHMWLDLTIAQKMVTDIAECLAGIDPTNAKFYRDNATAYNVKLNDLDSRFTDAAFNSERYMMVFGGRFAFAYFVRRYFLDYEAAYASCSAESEASVQSIAHIIDYIKTNKIPVIYYEELVDPRVARTISQQTGAKMLLFHTAHNVTKSEFDRGITFLEIMEQNLKNMIEGLN